MAEAFIVRRGGGAGGGDGTLLKVKAYPVGTDIDTISGKDGMVAILTDTPIYTWTVSAKAPENPASGDIWISVDNVSNEINIVKKNVLNVYPSFCSQYVFGEWKRMVAYIYKADTWVQFSYDTFYLYNSGDQCQTITGGWQVFNAGGANTTLEQTYINGNYASTSGAHSIIKTINKIQFPYGNFKTIHIIVDYEKQVSSGYPNRFGIYSYDGINNGSAQGFVAYVSYNTVGTNLEYTVDISNVSGDYYVAVGNIAKSKIKQIWLE